MSFSDADGIVAMQVDEDFDAQLAMAMSLSVANAEIRASDLPEYLVVFPIQPNGWCFYAGVLKHILPNANDNELMVPIAPATIACLCATCLLQMKNELAHIIADDACVRNKRRQSLQSHRMYMPHVESLDDFDLYVLDKFETALHSGEILDTHQYADIPEVEAFLRRFELTMLRVWPASEWCRRANDIGCMHGTNTEELYTTISDEGVLQETLESGEADLQFVRY